MAIGIDELYEDELFDDITSLESEDTPTYTQATPEPENDPVLESEESEDDAITLFLKSNGIEDINKIKFENEEGEMVERAWNDLTTEELLNILHSNKPESQEDQLDDDEIGFLNQLRSRGITPTQYVLAVLELLAQAQQTPVTPPEPSYSVDLLTDDELYILDLQTKIPDITDDELKQALDHAKVNEEFYKKLMSGIRADYLRMEQEATDREVAIAQLEQQQRYQLYSNAVYGLIANLTNIGDLDINMNEDDMDELADFILASDDLGVNYFQKALNDPQTLVQMAWFALHGEEIFNGISEYYNNEIKKAERAGYLRGKASVKTEEQKPAVVVLKSSEPLKKHSPHRTIDDLYDE